MSVSTETLTPEEFNCTGVTEFAITNFDWDDDSDLVVTYISAAGARTELTYNTDYTVSGSTITWAAAPSSGTLHVTRDTPLSQGLALVNGSDFDATEVNDAFDKLTFIVQEVLYRCLRIPVASASGFDGEIDYPDDNASKYLAINADGDGIMLVSTEVGSSLVSAFMETVLDDENATAALATLGLTVSTFAKTVLDDADAAAFMTTLGLSAFIQTLVDDADAATARATLDVPVGDDYLTKQNLVINGCCRVQQRTDYTLVKDQYSFSATPPQGGPDRFEGMATGTLVSAGTFGQTASPNIGSTGYAIKFAGVTLTGDGILYLRHRIEAKDAATLKNANASFGCKVYHDVGAAVDYTVTISKADVADDFSAVTQIVQADAVSVSDQTETDLTINSQAMGDCSTGIQIEIMIEAGAITTKNFEVADVQMVKGSLGNEFPIRSFCREKELCKRFYEKVSHGLRAGSSTVYYFNIPYAEKRSTPTITRAAWPLSPTDSVITVNLYMGALDVGVSSLTSVFTLVDAEF